ncbi:MAG: P63C domain-containing protein [Sphingobacterium sp.]|nr:P63C domain-containing protein [Sphingobacterium sp.]
MSNQQSKPSRQSKGGVARAEKLSPDKRSEIAKTAAAARWGIPKAEYRGEIFIGETRIPCAVLDDGRRVLSETGITTAILGGPTGAAKRRKKAASEAGALMPVFLASERLKPFISNEMMEGPLAPVTYVDGQRTIIGFEASILPAICEIWLRARDAGVLQEQQKDRAQRAEILMRGLAHIGIVGLVDEATGYQEVRDKRALQAILDKFLAKELAAWAKRFPDDFYKEMFRLKGWTWNPMSVARPGVVGRYTIDVVYERLAPGLVEELERINPKTESGARRARHHQWLTDDVGHPALAQHLHAVMGLMRACTEWGQFMSMLDRAFPRKGKTIQLLLE